MSTCLRVFLIAASLVLATVSARTVLAQQAAPAKTIDDAQLQSNGIRRLSSKYLVLFTDVPSSPEVDRLPAVFDEAVPQWAEYFGIDLSKKAPWQARGYMISDRRRFEALGLMPPGHEQFVNGISMGAELWLHDQPTDYYRRHLLLHEGTHVFMASFLGGCGPGWYMEGMAELFGTHRFDEQTGRLMLRSMPRNREEVPMLGRIKLIRDAVADGKPLTFEAVMRTDNRKQLASEAYAWCWAAAKFLDSHPRYRDMFHPLYASVLNPNFNQTVLRMYEVDWRDLTAEWQAYIATLDHGYDFERMAIKFRAGKPLAVGGKATAQIAADRGWQSSGVQLTAGKSYRVTAAGRYQIAAEQVDGVMKAWPCEPGGVSIEYNDGQPLGILLGAIYSGGEVPAGTKASFAAPTPIGLQAILKPSRDGTLYLRVNDSAAHLDDNRGTVAVTVEQVP
jgi:hypothetical protein